jgi:cell division GTPase FtsZ
MYAPRKLVRVYIPRRNKKMTEEQETNNEELEEVQEELENQIPDLEIPDIDLEDYEIPEDEETAIKDESGGSQTFAWIGSGQGGGRIAKAFYDRGYKKCIAVNTSSHDLDTLELPSQQKFLLDVGEQGAGKNMDKGHDAANKYKQNVFDLMRRIYGNHVDHVFVCVGAGGGSGSGSVLVLIETAKKYMEYIGHDDAEKRVGVVMSLPTRGEATSPQVSSNAYEVLKTVGEYAENGSISPLLIIDNSKIEKMYRGLTVKQFWPTVNNTISGLFHVFNVLTSNASPYTSFDPTDYAGVLRCGGVLVMGVAKLKEFDDEQKVSNAIKSNIEKTLLSEAELSDSKVAACIAVGSKDIMENTPGLMDSLSYGFDTLASLCPSAVLHRGIYEDNKDSLRLYTIVSGLGVPLKRLQQLNKGEKL